MQFPILSQSTDGTKKVFFYDNEKNELSDTDGVVMAYPKQQPQTCGDTDCTCATPQEQPSVFFRIDEPLKKAKQVRTLKIQLGLSCNYSCNYCSQRFVERPPETSKKHIAEFLEKLDNLEFSEEKGLKIEFWGGEPLVYWKTLKPLAEAIREKYQWKRPIIFSTITNGSLITDEIADWLYDMGFLVSISHDGPGQHLRGPDPLDDPETRDAILRFYHRMKGQGRISFNAMLTNENFSRKAIHDWFMTVTGDPEVPLGEGSVVDAYDEGGLENSFQTPEDHFTFRKTAFNDINANNGWIGFQGIIAKLNGFINNVLNNKSADGLGQKCGMDDENVIAIDLKGNVVTCQNVSISHVSDNGETHHAGNIADMDAVAITTSTHWRNRPNCASCPVLHLCQGSCMYLEGEKWDKSCANSYSDNITLFALAMYKITGYIPVYIDSPELPPIRRDIWGDILKHEAPRKKFPIPVVTR